MQAQAPNTKKRPRNKLGLTILIPPGPSDLAVERRNNNIYDALLQVRYLNSLHLLYLLALWSNNVLPTIAINWQRNSFFKTLVDHEVTVELKNDIQIRGTLKSVDQYLNIKLDDITVVEEIKYPHLVCLSKGKSCYIAVAICV